MSQLVISAVPGGGQAPEQATESPQRPAQATLIFNTKAGGSELISPENLVHLLEGAGYPAVYRPTESEEDLAGVLAQVSGHVFVAGGDGTIRAAALHLAGRSDVVLGVIPLGTANNIGRTLGVQGQPQDVIQSYRHAAPRPFDVGRVRAPWGEDLFLEACGCGAFADIITEYDPEGGKSPLRAVQALTTTLGSFAPPTICIALDGQPQPPTPYALLEVLNTRATGPRLQLATNADPGDGQLDVICIDAEHRQTMLAYLTALARDEFAELSSVQDHLARRIDIPYIGQAFHMDGEVRPPVPGASGTVQIEVWPAALQMLTPLPAQTQETP